MIEAVYDYLVRYSLPDQKTAQALLRSILNKLRNGTKEGES